MPVIFSLIGTVILYLLLSVFVFVPAAGGAVLALILLGAYLRAAQRVLAPWPPPADDPLIRVPGPATASLHTARTTPGRS